MQRKKKARQIHISTGERSFLVMHILSKGVYFDPLSELEKLHRVVQVCSRTHSHSPQLTVN